jgi:hypothetical protein
VVLKNSQTYLIGSSSHKVGRGVLTAPIHPTLPFILEFGAGASPKFGAWNLGFFWDLGFGVWSFSGAWILMFGSSLELGV